MWQLPETLREFVEAVGDDRIVLELIGSFRATLPAGWNVCTQPWPGSTPAEWNAEAHSMRGSASQMGAEALAELCRSVEAGAPRMNWPELECQVNQAEVRFAELRIAMSEYVDTKQRQLTAFEPRA